MVVCISSGARSGSARRSSSLRWVALLVPLGLMACTPAEPSGPVRGGPGGGPSGAAKASLFMEVQSPEGAAIPGVQVRLASGQRLRTDALGQLLLEDVQAGRQLLQLDAPGFVSTAVSLEVGKGVHAGARSQMLPLGEPAATFNTDTTFDSSDPINAGTWPYPDLHIIVEASTAPLHDAEGCPIQGEVELFLAPVNLESSELSAAPGAYQGVLLPGTPPVTLESLAMFALVFKKKGQSCPGQGPCCPAQGARATDVSISARRIGVRGGVPRSIRVNAEEEPGGSPSVLARSAALRDISGQQVPVWRWDSTLGYWVPTGDLGSIEKATSEGKFQWTLDLNSAPPLINLALPFWWREPKPDPAPPPVNPLRVPPVPWVETACLEVQVMANGQPVAGRTVVTQGKEYASASQALTNAQGLARLEVVRGKKAKVIVGEVSMEETINDAGDCQGNGGPPTRRTVLVPGRLCTPGEPRDCSYAGPVQTRGQGACRAGKVFCNAEGTAWSTSCQGEVLPQPQERCDTEEDDNCDGLVNEGCASQCREGQTRACYTGGPETQGVGQCRAGQQTCVASGTAWSPCEGQVLPGAEDCMRPEDENCDGVACLCWPGASQRCYTAAANTAEVGMCRAGSQLCNSAGTGWEPCTGELTPKTEICASMKDENCSGQEDESRYCGGWASAPHLKGRLRHHTATRLNTGKILVAGGNDGSRAVETAWLYDPYALGSDPWMRVGDMASARERHTATLLADGKVLVVGGENSNGVLETAEVFDPDNGNWSSGGVMNSKRKFHQATLLADGKVLFTGGNDGTPGGFLKTAELYEQPNIWLPVADMSSKRESHTATLLPNGQVLVWGGFNGTVLNSAEVYNHNPPASSYWTSLTVPYRYNHTATRLNDGTVLIVGGTNNAGNHLNTAEVYNSDANPPSWSTLPSRMISERDSHTATLLADGKVLVAGGYKSDYLVKAETYDPVAGTWSVVNSMVSPRNSHTATLLNTGKVLVMGGQNNTGNLDTAEVYEPATSTSSSLTGSMASFCGNHTTGGCTDSSPLTPAKQ